MITEQRHKACEQERDAQLRTKLYSYCLSLTRSPADAEDLVQETLLKAEARRQRRGDHVNPEALLLRMAKNTWIDGLRRTAVFRDVVERKLRHQEKYGAVGAEADMERMEAAFHVLMRDLSPPQRTVLLMREVLGYSAAECADHLGTTEGAVKSLLHRARHALAPARAEGAEAYEEALLDEGAPDYGELVEAYVRGDIERLLRLISGAESAPRTLVEAVSSIRMGSSTGGAAAPYASWTGMEMRLVS
ncbi:RNA polymerase sigma factor [Paenibacillus sp. 1P07SE]|uniref:RNA polymerase sigma factor n=1 Tax=Paenibacillus sp. 1P07SE TaxID=3132209 RepID=UPI0039A6B906